MSIVNALQMSKGAKVTPLYRTYGAVFQPYQMLPQKEKTPEWVSATIDFIEWEGLRQLKRNAGKLLKNYKLAIAEIEKSDYIVSESEYAEVIAPLVEEDVSALELKFYPIIPIVVDVLTNEFAKRYSRVTFELKDEQSANELLSAKYDEIGDVLLQKALVKQRAKMQQMGISDDSDQGKQMIDPNNLKTLPEIQEYYTNDYRSTYALWAEHQMAVDNDRFSIPELERQNFRTSLITDREFWHFPMGEDDYSVETWNPALTFYRKSPNTRYISDATWVGMTTLQTVPEVIDKYGWMMSQEQVETLNSLYPVRGNMYTQTGIGNESGAFYDPTMSYEWNTQGPGVAMRQFMSKYNNVMNNGDVVRWVVNESEDMSDTDSSYLIRVSTVYWKTQKLVGHLVKIDDTGNQIQEIVDETYKITDKPVYNTLIFKEKTKDNLIFGEHIDWFWINEVWGGYKIGPNIPGFIGMNNPNGFAPMYVGMQGGKPGKIKYQFKGGKTNWGCKLPVEGRVFNDYNTKSKSLVDRMKPYQVSFNMVLNQVQDLQVDELGKIIIFDQRLLPKHSMGEDWGDNNFQKAYVAMKNFSFMPIESSMENVGGMFNGMPVQHIDMSQHERIMSKIKQAEWIKQEALSAVGLNPQRLGMPIDKEQTASGVEQAINASYAQTEHYFIQHSDELMPRVHQMRTELAQYYNSTNPSVRLQYLTKNREQVMFMLNGNELIGRDFNVVCSTRVGMHNVIENIKQKVLHDNTTGVALWDQIKVIKADDMADLDNAIKLMEQKEDAAKQAEQQAEQEQLQQEQQHQLQMQQEQQQFQAAENQKNRDEKRYETELMAASKAATGKPAEDSESVYQSAVDKINMQDRQHQDKMNLEREKLATQNNLKSTDQQIQMQKIREESKRTSSNMKIAEINKNKAKKPSK